jgi:hypothetical protein
MSNSMSDDELKAAWKTGELRVNLSTRPEYVFTQEQWAALERSIEERRDSRGESNE